MEKNNFSSIDEAELVVNNYCKTRNHPVRLESRTTVAQYNRKTKESCQITDLPSSAIYGLRWVCKHFGTERVRNCRE